jgi:hypothetical protein
MKEATFMVMMITMMMKVKRNRRRNNLDREVNKTQSWIESTLK